MVRINYPEQWDEAATMEYPFESGVSRNNGVFTIDNDVFIDGRIFPPDGRHDVFISSIVIAEEIRITLADSSGELGFGVFDRVDPPTWVAFYISENTAERIHVGILVGHPTIGLTKLAGWPSGTYEFSIGQTRFAASVVVPQPQQCVREIQLESGALFHGDVTLVGEKGVQLTVQHLIGSSSSSSLGVGPWLADVENRIRVDVVGDPLFLRRECLDEGAQVPIDLSRVLQGITWEHGGAQTVIYPNDRGRLSFFVGSEAGGDPALRVIPQLNGLKIEFMGS